MVNLNTSFISSYHIKLSFCASKRFGHLIVVIIRTLLFYKDTHALSLG